MNPKLAGVSTTALLDELTRRLFKLQHDSLQARSVAHLRAVVDEAFKAGCSAGKLAQLTILRARLQQVLDEAVAAAPDPGGPEFERDYRRALYAAVDRAQRDIDTHIRTETAAAGALRARLELLVDEVLRPQRPLRVRVGGWLYDLAERIAARKAAA